MSAYTQADLDELKRARLGGRLSVSIGGRTVTYRSMEEIARAIEAVRRELAGEDATSRRLAEFSKGVQC